MDKVRSEFKIEGSRRKILKWLGLGAIGATAVKMLPMKKSVAKKLLNYDDRKIQISINKSAVKRNTRVKGNV
ncbi:MAG: hypothetical protein ACLP05_09355 [Candidatus Kryptoniota bacterium]